MAKDAPTPDQPGSVNLSPHPLVSKLNPDLDNPPDLVTLVGYLGPSKKADSTRLYQDLTFRNYYEVPSASITATTPVDADDPNSPTVIHVPASTTLEAVSTTSQSVEAGFLKGAITSSYLGSAGALPGAGQAAWWTGCCKESKTDVRAHAAVGQAPQACIQIMNTTVCTPTGVPYLCPQAGVDCVCILASAVGNTLAGQAQAGVDCVCILASAVGNTLAGQAPAGVDCVCILASAVGNTLAGQAQAGVNCVCILASAVGNTLAGQAQAGVGCACILASVVGNTLAGQAQTPVTNTMCPNCFVSRATLCGTCGCAQAAAGQAQGAGVRCDCVIGTYTGLPCTGAAAGQAGAGCIQIMNTTVCTPTGVPYLCPAGGAPHAQAQPGLTVFTVCTPVCDTYTPVHCAQAAGQAQVGTMPTLPPWCFPTLVGCPTVAGCPQGGPPHTFICPPPTIQCPPTLNCGGAGAVGRA